MVRALSKNPAERPSAQHLLDTLTGRPHADTAQAAASLSRTWSVPAGGRTVPDSPATQSAPPGPAGPAALGRRLGRRPPVLIAAGAAAVLVLGAGLLLLVRGPGRPPSKTTTVLADDFADTGAGWWGPKEMVRKSSAAGFDRGKKNRLQAACEQDGKMKVRLRLWINGTLAAETSDADGPLPNGGAGLMARLENGGPAATWKRSSTTSTCPRSADGRRRRPPHNSNQ